MAKKLRFGDGSVTVEMDDTLSRIANLALQKASPDIVKALEETAEGVYDDAFAEWPVKTGRSKAALVWGLRVSTDLERVSSFVSNTAPYAKFIKADKLGGRSAFVVLLRTPGRKAGKRLVKRLGAALIRGVGKAA